MKCSEITVDDTNVSLSMSNNGIILIDNVVDMSFFIYSYACKRTNQNYTVNCNLLQY